MIVLRFLTLTIVLLATSAIAQEWGVADNKELQLTADSAYPDAVMLFDIGQVTTEQRSLELERHTRLKVFTPDGIDRARTVSIEYLYYDELEGLKAQIIRGGSVIKLDKHAFETTEQGEMKTCEFVFENAQPGDILEYRYTIDYYGGYDKLGLEVYFLFNQEKGYRTYKAKKEITTSLDDLYDGISSMRNLPTWYFDHPIPCLRSEFAAKIGADYDFVYVPVNVPFDLQKPTMERVKILAATAYKKYTWYMTDIPTNESEKDKDYAPGIKRAGLHFNMFNSAGRGQNRMLLVAYTPKHWEYVGRNMQGYLNEYVKFSRTMRKKCKSIYSAEDSPADKVQKIAAFVKERMTADSSGYSLRPAHTSMKKLYKEKHGKPFEVNILLVAMLNRAGLDAWPVLISTKDKMPFEQSGRFNHMVAWVEIEGTPTILDMSSPDLSIDQLPEKVRVDKGVLIDYNHSRMVEFPEA